MDGRAGVLSGYARAVAIVALAAGAAAAARALVSLPDVEMLFLLGVTLVAVSSGRGPSLLASALSVAAYDFFFVPPPLTLGVADARYLLTFAMMFGIGIVISTLALRVREQEQAAVAREQRTSALYALSRQLGSALDGSEIARVCVRAAAGALDAEAVLLVPGRGGDLAALAAFPAGAVLRDAELNVATWVLHHAGGAAGTAAPAERGVFCAPLRTVVDVLAVLAIRLPPGNDVRPDQRDFVDALCRQGALALERVKLADAARRAAVRAEAEELRSSLLSAVSHDVRTPLAAITGAVTALRDDGTLEEETRRDLVETACEEADRLARLVSNVLDITRLEAGAVTPRLEWVPLVELVGAALTRLETSLAARPVTTVIPEDLPLLSVDPVLMEQLFLNLVENATKYTPAGSGIEIRASRAANEVIVEVADRGAGLRPGEEERVFERFHRGAPPGVAGVGLGLPIARAIARVHGGELEARSRPGGGALFRLTLPLAPSPPAPELDAEGGGR
jgi:two-component system sensor histidine kinase KdpD